jgi:excisionase family DNA binding protein
MELKEARRVLSQTFRRDEPSIRYGLFRIPHAAQILGIHPETIYRRIRRGQIRSYGYRGTRRVRLEDVMPERIARSSEE